MEVDAIKHIAIDPAKMGYKWDGSRKHGVFGLICPAKSSNRGGSMEKLEAGGG